MIKLSKWSFKDISDIQEVVSKLNKNKEVEINMKWDERSLFYKFQEKNNFGLGNYKEIDIDGESVKYIFLNAFIERPKRSWEDDQPLEERINTYTSDILIYQDRDKVKLIILSSKSNSIRIINSMFKEDEWGEIVEDNNIDNDLLYWVFYRLREFSNTELLKDSELYLTGLVSYMGKSKDEINAVRGQGVRVGALLGTLAFIFNDDRLKSLRPEIQYKNHVVVTEMNFNNSHKIDESSYLGELSIIEDEELKKISLIILTCKVIIPRLEKAYKKSIDCGEWSNHIKLSFLRNIGNVINEKVSNQMDRIQEEMNQLCEIDGDYECEDDFDLDLESIEVELEEDLNE
ncbi:hypothetical protein NSA45_11225 [Paraclostridium bifermentans]|uniref:hypothetical protein n=1 Tax=Paraclostridium bifermentans TaxID=1490 RepID=UPI00214A3C7E|nr:hypothetical protein [Paraclostridium bifermentans]MCR1876441.1 hypothetical protein [Paraclostridium bifermentans]